MLPWPGARGARGLGQDGDVPAAPKASPGMGQWGWSRAVTEAVTFLTGPAGRSSQWTEAEGHWAGSQASGGRALRLPTSPPGPAQPLRPPHAHPTGPETAVRPG